MKIAIIGSGISGLSTAFYLSKFSDITLFEKNNKFGGHANTYDFNYVKIVVEGIEGCYLSRDQKGKLVFNKFCYIVYR